MVLLKISVNSWYLKETLERSGDSASFVELAWLFKEQRQSSKLLEPGSFNTHKNTAAVMIVMLDCSEINIEILDAGIETTGSDDCRGMSGNYGDINSMLATICERARFSYKYG